jgi:hypothetical protein
LFQREGGPWLDSLDDPDRMCATSDWYAVIAAVPAMPASTPTVSAAADSARASTPSPFPSASTP